MLKHCRPDILARGHLSLLHRSLDLESWPWLWVRPDREKLASYFISILKITYMSSSSTYMSSRHWIFCTQITIHSRLYMVYVYPTHLKPRSHFPGFGPGTARSVSAGNSGWNEHFPGTLRDKTRKSHGLVTDDKPGSWNLGRIVKWTRTSHGIVTVYSRTTPGQLPDNSRTTPGLPILPGRVTEYPRTRHGIPRTRHGRPRMSHGWAMEYPDEPRNRCGQLTERPGVPRITTPGRSRARSGEVGPGLKQI